MCRELFKPDEIVKTCPKLESGLFLGSDGLRSCARGALLPPIFITREEINAGHVTKELIVERRKKCIAMLNDSHSDMDCKRCLMVESKRYGDIGFSHLGHIDLQHYTLCNLRCSYCTYGRSKQQYPPQYDALGILHLFDKEDVMWNAHVDFAGGEPTLLDNLKDYLEFFRARRIRVLMHTNAVRFSKNIYDGLADGSIYWCTVSVDAGTPSTYRRLRGGDYYLQLLENLSRYAVAGSKGKGMLAVKYIFCKSNCGADDIAGFAYAMLALRPQKIWLTFDFTPLYNQQTGYDFSTQIDAYVKMYLLLKKHGIEAFHYFKEAVASVSREGKDIMDRVLANIERESCAVQQLDPDLLFTDFRNNQPIPVGNPDQFSIKPFRVIKDDGSTEKRDFSGKRVLLVPACPKTLALLSDDTIRQAEWIGLVDRNPVQQGKFVGGCQIYGYENIVSLDADIILMAAPEKHRNDILASILNCMSCDSELLELRQAETNSV